MPVLAAHIIALNHVLSPATIRDNIDHFFFQGKGATMHAVNFDTNCHRRQNMPSTLKQTVAKNSEIPTNLMYLYNIEN